MTATRKVLIKKECSVCGNITDDWMSCEACKKPICAECINDNIFRVQRGPDDYIDLCIECSGGGCGHC